MENEMFKDIHYFARANMTEYFFIDDDFVMDMEVCWPSDIDKSEGVWIDREFIYIPW
jgi:hypothetical protein